MASQKFFAGGASAEGFPLPGDAQADRIRTEAAVRAKRFFTG
jgi:hypothetical protein